MNLISTLVLASAATASAAGEITMKYYFGAR